MAELRSKPYIYVTWMARLLAGTRSCEWASWFKTQHEGWSWKKMPSDFDLAAWTMRHAALVMVERDRLEAEGAEVFAEQQNHFKIRGRAATLSGQPDLVSATEERVVVHDVKTGEPNTADAAQVLLYMWALPLAKPRYRDVALEGRVVYADHAFDIPASAVNDEFKANARRAYRAACRRVAHAQDSQPLGVRLLRDHGGRLPRPHRGKAADGGDRGLLDQPASGPGRKAQARPAAAARLPPPPSSSRPA